MLFSPDNSIRSWRETALQAVSTVGSALKIFFWSERSELDVNHTPSPCLIIDEGEGGHSQSEENARIPRFKLLSDKATARDWPESSYYFV